MNHGDDQNMVALLTVEDHVAAMFVTADSTPDRIGGPANSGMPGEHGEAGFQFHSIAVGLTRSELLNPIEVDIDKFARCALRNSIATHAKFRGA